MSNDNILIIKDVEHQTRILQLNRPEKLNALNNALLWQVADALIAAEADDAIRVVILTGNEKAFAAGADLNELKDVTAQGALTDSRLKAFEIVRKFVKPLIAAVEGFALGGGLELTLSCDIAIVAEGAKLGVPEVKVGVMPGAGGTQILPRMVGKAMAMKMALSAQFISADEALSCGIAAEKTEKGGALAAAQTLAKHISRNAPFAVQSAKASILNSFNSSLDEGLKYERSRFAVLQATEDKVEGMDAFLSKRPPEFKGK